MGPGVPAQDEFVLSPSALTHFKATGVLGSAIPELGIGSENPVREALDVIDIVLHGVSSGDVLL